MELPLSAWLPITKKEVENRGWEELDVIIVSGDAYVDHPAFGAAVIGRILEHNGFKVGIIPQPNWRDDLRDFKKFGKPRLFFGVSAGSMDSMVNHYTARKRLRSDDAYTPGGVAGFRPDYPTIVYTKILKQLFPDTPVVIGGIEASLRRVTHYDYWQNCLRPSFLIESGADLLSYGMGEKSTIDIANTLNAGGNIQDCYKINQVSYALNKSESNSYTIEVNSTTIESGNKNEINDSESKVNSTIDNINNLENTDSSLTSTYKEPDIFLASHKQCLKDKRSQAKNFALIEEASISFNCGRILQNASNKTIIINPPYPVGHKNEIDIAFDLNYTRLPHPKYKNRGEIPAYTMIRHSINIHRGCFGGCSFCTISAHQGKQVQSRSEKSILKEVEKVCQMPDFKGYLSDLGGPSANMYLMQGKDLKMCYSCKRPSCIFPNICKNLNHDHKPLLDLYKKVSAHNKIKKCFIGSGIRYDMIVPFLKNNINNSRDYISEIIVNGVSGRLKVAPEHTEKNVLDTMRKMPFGQFVEFKQFFEKLCKQKGLNQQLIPYLISAHPACTKDDMLALAEKTRDLGYRLEQVQTFTPTPMTLSTEMYYTGLNPYTLEKVYTAYSLQDRDEQNNCFFWWKKEDMGTNRGQNRYNSENNRSNNNPNYANNSSNNNSNNSKYNSGNNSNSNSDSNSNSKYGRSKNNESNKGYNPKNNRRRP